MTLWQDARPLTRREARENEREASLERERKSGSRRSAVIEAEAVRWSTRPARQRHLSQLLNRTPLA